MKEILLREIIVRVGDDLTGLMTIANQFGLNGFKITRTEMTGRSPCIAGESMTVKIYGFKNVLCPVM